MTVLIIADAMHLYRSNRRNYFVLRVVLCIAVCLGIARIVPIMDNGGGLGVLYNYMTRFLLFILTVGASAVCFKNNFFYMFNRCMFGYATFCCSYVWGLMIVTIFELTDPVYNIVFWVMFAFSYGIFFWFSLIKNKPKKIKINSKIKTLIIMLVVSVSYGFIALHISYEELIYISIPATFAIAYLGFLMLTTHTAEKHLQDDNEVLQQILEKESRHYELSKEYIDIINVKCHDLKHQIRSIREGNGDINNTVLDEIEKAVDVYDADIKTGNKALDIVLTEKNRSCAKNDIKISCIADGSLLSFMQSTDIYSLMGNIFDNAIEAVCGFESKGKKTIGLIIAEEQGIIRIRVENYYEGTIKMKDGVPLTTKNDNYNHGFGTKSIRMITEKYGGAASFASNGNTFVVNLLIPFPSE